MAGVWTNKHG